MCLQSLYPTSGIIGRDENEIAKSQDNELALVKITAYDLPSKAKRMFFSIVKTMRHGSFALVHSVVKKIWYRLGR